MILGKSRCSVQGPVARPIEVEAWCDANRHSSHQQGQGGVSHFLDLTLVAAVHDFDPLYDARTRMAVTTAGRTWTWTRCPAPQWMMSGWMRRHEEVWWKTGANEERPDLVGHVGNGHPPAPSTAPCSLAAGGARLSLHLGGSDPRAPPNEIASTRLTRAVAVTAVTGSLQCCCILLHSIWTRENWGSVSGELQAHLVHGFPTDRVGSRSSRLLFCSSLLIPGPVSILQSFQVAQHKACGSPDMDRRVSQRN